MKILINHVPVKAFHATDWAKKWIEYCERENIEHIETDLLSALNEAHTDPRRYVFLHA